jgi:hypothetical protein
MSDLHQSADRVFVRANARRGNTTVPMTSRLLSDAADLFASDSRLMPKLKFCPLMYCGRGCPLLPRITAPPGSLHIGGRR